LPSFESAVKIPVVYMKMRRLGLVEVDSKKIKSTTTVQLESDADLLNPKEALDLLSGSMLKMKRGRLSKLELLEVRTVD
jgi:hypothetical protein